MENPASSQAQTKLDFLPALKLYFESLEVWKNNCDQFMAASKSSHPEDAPNILPFTGTLESSDLQKSAEVLFKRLVENQIELCRFYGKRWEEYLTITGKLHQCKSMADFTQLQTAFLSKMMNDYTQEAKRLSESMLDFSNKPETR